MKQKLFLGALLLGALTLNSCVDDTESASVTALRQAKIEQLKSLAELNSADAKAHLMLAEAQAAAENAEAEYRKAQAEYQKAQTEKEKELAQIAIDEARARLQAALAQFDAQIAQSKYNAANYEKLLQDILKNAEGEKAQELQNLLSEYEFASKNLIDAKRSLARNNANLISLESGLASLSESINEAIQDYEDENAEKQLEISKQQAIIDTYKKYAGKTVTQEDVDAAHLKMVELAVASDQAYEKLDAASDVKTEAEKPLVEYGDEVRNNWLNPYNGQEYWNSIHWSEWNETTQRRDCYTVTIERVWNDVPSAMRGQYCVVIDHNRNNQKEYLPLFEPDEMNWDNEIDYTLSDSEGTHSYGTYESYYNLIDGGKALQTVVSHKEKQIESWSDPEYLEQMKKNLAQYKKNQEKAQADFDAAVKKHNEAKAKAEEASKKAEDANKAAQAAWKAYDDNTDPAKAETLMTAAQAAETKANEANTAADKAWNDANTAEGARVNARDVLDDATTLVNDTQSSLNNQEANIEMWTEELAEFKEKVAKLIEMGTANVDNVKAYNEAAKARAEAVVAANVARDAYGVQNAEYNSLYSALNNGGLVDGNWQANIKVINATNQIEWLKDEIENNEEGIADCKQKLADIEAGKDFDAEQQKSWIEDMKAEIEKNTVAVEVAQKKYDIAKAALDAAVKADETEEAE